MSPAEHQGAYLGLNQSLGSLARVLGPVMAGWLFQTGHAGLPFLVGAGLLFFATAVAFTYHRRFSSLFTRKGVTSA